MNTKEKALHRISCGDYPAYQTQREKLLWRNNCYDQYSRITKSDILEDAFGKFWGYSDNSRLTPLEIHDVEKIKIKKKPKKVY